MIPHKVFDSLATGAIALFKGPLLFLILLSVVISIVRNRPKPLVVRPRTLPPPFGR